MAVLVLPGDVSLLEVEGDVPGFAFPSPVPGAAAPHDVQAAADILNGAERGDDPRGLGLRRRARCRRSLAEKLAAPVVHAFRGKEHVEWNNPFDVGMTGFIGFPSGYHALKECDALLMLGTDFPYRNFYPGSAKVVQADRDPGGAGQAGTP